MPPTLSPKNWNCTYIETSATRKPGTATPRKASTVMM